MASRVQICADARRTFCGANMLKLAEAAQYMGVSLNTARRLLEGLDVYAVGGVKKYLTIDVARRIDGMKIDAGK